jgi:hypothetical protein
MVGHNRRDIIYFSSLTRLGHFDNILDVPQAPAPAIVADFHRLNASTRLA